MQLPGSAEKYRIRRNGGARDLLAPKGIAILWGKGNDWLIGKLKLGPVGPDEFISYKPTDPVEIALLRNALHIETNDPPKRRKLT